MSWPCIPLWCNPQRVQQRKEYVPAVRATNSTVSVWPFSIFWQSSGDEKTRPGSPLAAASSGHRLILKPCAWSVAVILSWTLVPCLTRIGDGLNSYFFAVTSMTCTFSVPFAGRFAGLAMLLLPRKRVAVTVSQKGNKDDLIVILRNTIQAKSY